MIATKKIPTFIPETIFYTPLKTFSLTLVNSFSEAYAKCNFFLAFCRLCRIIKCFLRSVINFNNTVKTQTCSIIFLYTPLRIFSLINIGESITFFLTLVNRGLFL